MGISKRRYYSLDLRRLLAGIPTDRQDKEALAAKERELLGRVLDQNWPLPWQSDASTPF